MTSSQPRIAIVGGGPAGLTTGLLLHRRGIPSTIFEHRQKPSDEELAGVSGMLDLHEESGIAAIKECGLYEDFIKLTGECAEAQRVADKDGNILYEDEGELSQRPEISRFALTKLLISHIPADHIQWDHKLLSATASKSPGSTEVDLDFGPQGKKAFDLVIGADGTWSKVRKLLTEVKPQYEGRQIVTITILEVTKKYPHLAELVGLGSFSALGNRHGVMSQRGPQDSARIYVVLTTEDEDFASTAGLAGQTAAVAVGKILADPKLLGTWGPIMKELVTVASNEEVVNRPGAAVDSRPLYVLPIGHIWEHKVGATLIGDAGHVMGPWAGEGVNLAMWDSLLLARAITKAYRNSEYDAISFLRSLDPLTRDFEAEMTMRVKEKAEESFNNGQMLFGDDAAKEFVAFFLNAYQHLGEPDP